MRDEDDTKHLIDALKKHRPHAVRITVDDKPQRIAVKQKSGSKRVEWAPVAKTVQAYEWTLCELLGKSDEVLHVITPTEEEPAAPIGESHIERMLRLCNEHADKAVQRHIESLGPTLDIAFKQVGMLAEQLVQERKDNLRQVQATANMTDQLANMAKKVQAGESDGGDLMNLLTQLPKVLPAVEAVMSMMGGDGGPKPPKHANGTAPAAKKPPIDVAA